MKHTWTLDSEGEVDTYAYADNFCNGPVCSVCDQAWCRWCVHGGLDHIMAFNDCPGE